MTQRPVGYADSDLVTAVVKLRDHLKARALLHLETHAVRVPFSVGIELLFVAQKAGVGYADFIGAATQHFEMDRADVVLAAAEALDKGELTSPFDAVHASQALADGTHLHTSDRRIQESEFPTIPF